MSRQFDYNKYYEEMKVLRGEEWANKDRDRRAIDFEKGRYAGDSGFNGGQQRTAAKHNAHIKNRAMSQGAYALKQNHYRDGDDKRHKALQDRIGKLESQKKAAPAPKPKPKPKGDQQIDPVKHSAEIQSAKEKADSWLKGSQNDYSSIFKTDPNQNASGGFDIGGKGSQTSFDPMKYMQDFTGSGQQQKEQNAQTHEVESSAMSAQEILRKDKEQGWS